MNLLINIPPFLTLCCFLGLAVLTVIRGRRTKTNILFFITCILGAFLYIDILFAFNVKTAELALIISRVDHFFIIYLFPIYIHFFHSYLNISGKIWLIRLSYAFAFILMWFIPTPLYIESMQKHSFGFFAKGGVLYPLFGIGGLCVTIIVLTLIFQAILNEKKSIRKNRLKYVFAGFGVMGVMNGLNVLPIMGYSIYPPGSFSFIPLVVFAIGLFKHDLLDMGILIKKSLVYSLITAMLTCMYALIIILANRLFTDFDFSDSIFFHLLFFLLIAFAIGPLKAKIQGLIDNIFSKGKYDYQKTIKDVSRMIASVLNLDEIAKLIMDTVVNVMKVDYCGLFLCDLSESGCKHFASRGKYSDSVSSISMADIDSIVQYIKRQRRPIIRKKLMEQSGEPDIPDVLSGMDSLYAEIIFPMIFEKRLNGFIVLGEKLSGDLFTPEDMDLLETLASQCALSVENARSYKLIDDLNKNLEKKVRERTFALQEALSEKERTQEQLIRSESLAAIGQLVAGTAHELNNPLTSVTSLIQSTIEDLSQWDNSTLLDQDLIDDLRFADKELGRARSIVASLLGLSRQTQTYEEAVNLNLVIQDALRILYNQYKGRDIELIENYDQDLPDIRGNFANLGQVVMNIIKNGIQAVEGKKGLISLSTRFDNDTRQVVFECEDNGPGIPKSHRQDIFKPFFTTKEVGKGTGLGLYICHEIIQKHGGDITVEDSERQGAKFVISLPVDD
ncbi:MAG: GAF domain-containing protein [Desulfobacteraceae bacterium]|uniref:histidine kinase n=1 Tax=Candidatus Desulfaltia bathyphila TaxID=2841697 RepID=A0A8J6N6R1_9BACT|nr:GAF domain-containing protein [Candidatus Desulfaltia bathyphila]MBL7195937.1 GAF domain-containing protein [Desulfobacterales bacterium]